MVYGQNNGNKTKSTPSLLGPYGKLWILERKNLIHDLPYGPYTWLIRGIHVAALYLID